MLKVRWIFFFLVIFWLVSCSGSSDEYVDLKAIWYRDALELMRTKYTKVRIAIVYHGTWQNSDESWSDLRINSSPEALAAFREGISSPYYLGKEFLKIKGGSFSLEVTGCYTGVFPGWGEYEDEVSSSVLYDFEDLSGKSVAFVPFSVFWGRNYISSHNLDEIGKYGAIPMVRLMPWGEPYWVAGYQDKYSLQRIIDGEFDDFIRGWADVIRDYQKPVMVTFGEEMNGDWFPWSGVFQGGDETTGYGDPRLPDGPERFVDAFRHVVDIFRAEAVTNAVWYYQVNYDSQPPEEWNNIEAYYPGDDYVDWVAISVYGAQTPSDPWVSFESVMEPIYEEITSAFPQKPLMVAEWGVTERRVKK